MIRLMVAIIAFLLALQVDAKSVTIRRVHIDGVRIDLIEPPDEDTYKGSLVVLFYREKPDDTPDQYLAGRIWKRQGAVSRIQGEALADGSIQLRVYLRKESSDTVDQVIFKLPRWTGGPPPYSLMALGTPDD